ncbi:MAG: SCO family protein [Burkholderiales bacterium]
MQSHNSDAAAPKRRSTLTLWLILAVCAAPIVASYLAFYVWQPASHVNYGELLEPRAVPDGALRRLDGLAFRFSELRGSWVLLVTDGAQCDERCRLKLTYVRQVRLAQGKETERIERAWLATGEGTPDAKLVAEHPGLNIVRADPGFVAAVLPAPRAAAEHVYVIDPLGNLMMRFPPDPDPRRMLKDVARLLRHSKWK